MRSVTPKVLHRIGGRSLVDHAVTAARGLEPQHLVVVVRHERDAVIAHLAEVAPDAVPADQDEVPGTGRAVACGLAALPEDLDGPVVVTSGDVPLLDTATLKELLAQHHERGDAVTLLTTELEDPTGYGRVVREADGTVSAVVEQRDASEAQRAIREINAGVYVFDAAHLRTALATLGTDNDQGEVYLTDVVADAHRAGRSTSALVATDHWLVEGCNGLHLGGRHRRAHPGRHPRAGRPRARNHPDRPGRPRGRLRDPHRRRHPGRLRRGPLQPARRRRRPGLTHERSAASAPTGPAVRGVPAGAITDLHLRLQQSHRGPHRP